MISSFRVDTSFMTWKLFGGTVTNIGKTKGGEIFKITIEHDDGVEEEWLAWWWYCLDTSDIVGDAHNKKMRKGEAAEGSPRMFICGEEGCEYEAGCC